MRGSGLPENGGWPVERYVVQKM